jgi:hypothetical protein
MNQDNYLERLIYRIIQGRLRVSVDGLVFYIHEPTADLILQSYDVYDEVYEESYMSKVYTDDELANFLAENDIWTPLGDREIEKIKKDLEDKKVEAFQNFFRPGQLVGIKRQIQNLNNRLSDLLNQKHSFDHITCHGAAEQARWDWLLQNCIFDLSGNKVILDIAKVSEEFRDNVISPTDIRAVARSNMWRTIWTAGKKSVGVFSKPSTELTRDQLTLMSFSSMYDNVYEHPDCPDDKIIEDDDCLDGWFIVQRRKAEKDKTQRSVDQATSNPKIRNAKEQFIMVESDEDAKRVMDLNDPLSKAKIAQRAAVVESKGTAKDMDFVDVKNDIEIMKNQAIVNKARGR